MSPSLNEIYEKIDKAITYLSQDKPIDKWKIQKSVFYFLWLDSLNNHYDFMEVANKIQIHPDKQGPYSEAIAGEVEMLVRDGFLKAIDPYSKEFPVKALPKGISEFKKGIDAKEEFCLLKIKNIVNMLDSYEVVFFIYYNPYIPENIKKYFISQSEIKEGFLLKKDKYIKKLLECGLIDDLTANKMLKKIAETE
ncbi:MAG: hypothetical protein WA130_21290 [Candidatus Methanoperedens sp.]